VGSKEPDRLGFALAIIAAAVGISAMVTAVFFAFSVTGWMLGMK
jgi:hypothetical protein